MKVKTKIIATIGPSSQKPGVLRALMREGVDIVRLNFSHGTHATHARTVRTVRALNKQCRRSMKIMQDLEGYRIRVGHLGRPLELKKNAVVTIYQDGHSNKSSLSFPIDLKSSFKIFSAGEFFYVDDGKISLQALESSARTVRARVIAGGTVQSRKGVNASTLKIPVSSLTEKDLNDSLFAVRHNVEYIAQSFVRSAEDIHMLRRALRARRYSCEIIAKIESQEGIDNIDGIIDAADGIIVARGDLGVSVTIYKLPMAQKQLIRQCSRKKKMSVVATQMLDSMMHNPFPTRAEVSDVANAILDGADALLLSGETAVGKYPVESVRVMNKISKEIEQALKGSV